MGNNSEAFVAFDTSKLRNAVAIADVGRTGEVRFLGETPAGNPYLGVLMVRSTEKLVPAPISVPRPTWIGRFLSLATRRRNSPLPRNRFEVGQWAIEASRSCTRANSESENQTPWPRMVRRRTRP